MFIIKKINNTASQMCHLWHGSGLPKRLAKTQLKYNHIMHCDMKISIRNCDSLIYNSPSLLV